MGFRINRGIFQFLPPGETEFINKFKIAEDGEMVEVDRDGNPTTAYMKIGDKATDADKLDGINSTGFVKTANNSTLNTDTRNTRGATRLFRNDSDSNYSVQHYWTGSHWFLRGYSGDTFHAEVRVGKADSADNATNASYLTGGDTSFRGLLYHSLNGDLNHYNVAGLYSAEYVGSTNIPLDQRGHFIQISDAGGTDVKTQWYSQFDGEKIHMRLMWGNQNWQEWRELITDSNIGSQSVNYASSAGNADTVDGYHANNSGGGIPVLNSNGYWDAPSWINVRGTGLYSSTTNGAHFYPNDRTYGSWRIVGTRNGWYGIHFGGDNGSVLMMNEGESGIYRQGVGWKFRHYEGKFLISTGTTGGGAEHEAWHKGNLTPVPYSTSQFFVGGDPETYYPVLLNKSSRTTGKFTIYRDNVHQDESGRGAGRLVLTGFTSGWGHVPLTLHYETKMSGTVLWKFLASNYRTGLMVVYLKGATTYYYKSEHGFTLHDGNSEGSDKSDGRTNWLPTKASDANAAWEGETPSVLTIEHGVSYYDGYVKAAGFKGDGANLTDVDAQTLDGINSTSFLRSDTTDTASSRIDFTADESIRLKGIRGQFTNEYMHLYNKVGIGHPNGWGQGEADTPNQGLSTYGGANFAYGNNATSSFKGSLRVDVNWGANEYPEQFTIRGTYPSIALRSTQHDAKWLIHNDNNVSWYYGSAVDTADWALKFRIATNGNIWMQWAGGWLSDLLNAKEEAGSANTVETALNTRIDEELRPAIDTAQATADSAVTAAAAAQSTADTALARADGAREDTVVIGELATAAQAAADAAQATADGKLGATAKAADSDKLDGINSSQFLRSDASDTMGGNLTLKYNTSNASDYNALTFAPYNDAAGINDYIIKAESSRGVFGRKSFGWHVHTNSAFGVYSNGWEKLFGVEGGTGNSFVKGTFTANNISTNQVFMQSITSDGTIANDKGSYLHLGGWAVGRTHASAVLVNTAYRADYATSLFDMNISRFTNNSGYITQSSIDTFAEEVRGEIQTAQTTADNAATAAATAQTTADGKLGATAKAADADKLDGYDWMQSGKSVRANEFYADNWFRNYNSGEGLYNEATGAHIVSDANERWTIRDAGNTIAIRFATNGNVQRGQVYANNSDDIGFLDAGGSWAVKHTNDNGTRFYTDGAGLEFSVGRDTIGASFGTVRTHTTLNGYGGYSIAGRVVFMHDHSNTWGIYNDVNNEWMIDGTLNGHVNLRHNAVTKLTTTSTGVTVTGAVTATSFSGDGSALTNLPVVDQTIPVTINGEGNDRIVSINMNLDMGQIEFTLTNGQTFTAMMGR